MRQSQDKIDKRTKTGGICSSVGLVLVMEDVYKT